jgi:hypothetical protein
MDALVEAPRRLDMRTGNRVHPVAERSFDLYETPAVAIKALLAVEKVPSLVWEPACGPGAIVRVLEAAGHVVAASDLIDYGCPGQQVADFFGSTYLPTWSKAIVTNPPFMHAVPFVARALDLCPEVYLMMRSGFINGARWKRLGWDQHLARVHIFAPRLPMMHRGSWTGPRTTSPAIDFAWFVFRRDWKLHGGQPTVNWIDWKAMFPEDDPSRAHARVMDAKPSKEVA